MTAAVTSLAEVAAGRRRLSASGSAAPRGEARNVRPANISEPPAATPPTVRTGVTKAGYAVVAEADLECVRAALAGALSGHVNQGGQPAVAAAYRRILGLLGGHVRATPRQDPPGVNQAGETGPGGGLAAVVEGLDGTERKLLLNHLADSDPDVVEAGLAWLAEWHAGNAERRRVSRNRKAKGRRRRQRADSRDGIRAG